MTDDEVGVVIDAFNKMLDDVQSHARALENSEKLYRAIGESINYGVWVTDADGRCIYMSDSFLKLIGLTMQQAANDGWGSVLHPDDVEDTMAAWKETARTGSTWYREHRIMGVDGRYHSILAQGVPIRDEAGHVQRWAGINLDISRLKNTERALLEADRRKDEFLATLAHELRNPLAPIRQATIISMSPGASDEQKQWSHEVITRQVRHMSLLLDDLLDISRITRGTLELRTEMADLAEVVEAAIETSRPVIDSKLHSLQLDLPAEPTHFAADPLRLAQVLSNLLTNAAKYTDPRGSIQIRAAADDRNVEISVIDSGVGLTQDALSAVFTMFSQVRSTQDRSEGGLGIGLALSKGVVELHGGTLEAHSAGPGKGSEFIVRLPRRTLAGSLPPPTTATAPAQANKRRVLIADDNRDAADSISMLLQMAGHEVTVAYDGQQALESIETLRPEVALLDIGMPGLDGFEVARRVRLDIRIRNTLLIAVTGWGQASDKARALAAGFDLHFTKPVEPATLIELLGKKLPTR
jgi:PAS domain S-box-containing protein